MSGKSNFIVRGGLDMGNLTKGLNQTQKQLSNFQATTNKSMSKVGAGLKLALGYVSVRAITGFAKSCVEIASNLAEVQNVVDVTFGSMTGDINAWSKTALQQFGLSELSAKKYSSTMGAMLKSSGLVGPQMAEMSKSIAGLVGDMASFYNLDTDEAFTKIRSGISGETEPLKQLGINMSVANLQAYALTKGIQKQYSAMSQAEQTLLRYNYLLSVSKDAQGDFARTSGSWANQTRLLSEQWKIFQGTMGQGFINMFAPILQGFNFLIVKIQVAAEYFKAFTALIFGSAQATAASGVSTDSTAESLNNVEDAYTGASKAAKKAAKSVAGFDELNTLSKPVAVSDGGMPSGAAAVSGVSLGGASAGTPDIGVDSTMLQPMLDMLNKIKAVAVEIGSFLIGAFGQPIKDAIAATAPALEGWKESFKTLFNDLIGLAQPFAEWVLTSLVPAWQQVIPIMGNILGGLLDTARVVFDGILQAVMPVINWLVSSGLPLMTSFEVGCWQVFQSIFNSAKSVFDMLWSNGIKPGLDLLSTMVVGVLDSLKGFWDTFGGDIIKGLQTAVGSMASVLTNWWNTTLKPIWDTILNTIKWLWQAHLKGLIDQVLVFVGKLVTGALEIYNKFIVPLVNWFTKMFGPAISRAFQTVVSILGTLFAAVSDIVKGIFKVLGGLIDFIVGVFTGNWRKAWDGVKDVFSGIFDMIVGILKGAINLILDGINCLIRGLNSIKFDVPDWVPLIGGKKFGISIPEIPKLAKGGITNGPMVAMIGDNPGGREVVSPLDDLQDMIAAAVSDAMRSSKGSNQSSSGPTTLIMQVGQTEIGRVVINAINAVQRQAGMTLLEV